MLLLVCCEVPEAFSQLRSLDVSQYLHTSWSAQQGYFRGVGISNNAIAQTSDGYIWFLSPTGVFRFDGVRFVDWKPPNGGQLPGSPPTQLLASRDGSLWIGGDGVAQLRPDGTWHRYHELDDLRRVRLAEDSNGVIWVGAEKSPTPTDYSLFSIDHGKVIAHKLREFAGLGLTPLLADDEGRLWADSQKGIWQLLPGPPKLVLKKKVPTPVFCEDAAGELLFAEGGRVLKLTAQGTVEDYFGKLQTSPLNVRTMMRDSDGGLWIGTFGQGIVHFHEGRLDHFTSVDGLSSDTVESIFQDREGNVWVTSPDSIDEFTRPAVPRLTRKQGLSADSVFSVLTDRRGRTWVGTSDGFDEIVRNRISRPGRQLHNDAGLALAETRGGGLILTTHIRGEVAEGHARRVSSGIPGVSWLDGYKNVFSIAEDSDGTFWAVSQQLGLLHLHKDGELIKAINDPDRGDFPVSVAFDRKRDGVWFSTHNGRVYFVKGGKILEHYGAAEGLGQSAVRIDEVDDDGSLWMAAKSGLVHLMDHKIFILGMKNGLPCQNVHWMRRDRYHHVWLYTECGLISFSERDLSSWIAQPSKSVTVTDYLDNTDGVENTAVGGWYAPESTMTADGRILFAMRTGLGVLDPRDLNRNPLPPPVHIEGIMADGREVNIAHDVSLPANTAVIHIEYTALSFVSPRKVLFRYK
jgi:ligand-binding sensor domain-containing protein